MEYDEVMLRLGALEDAGDPRAAANLPCHGTTAAESVDTGSIFVDGDMVQMLDPPLSAGQFCVRLTVQPASATLSTLSAALMTWTARTRQAPTGPSLRPLRPSLPR